MFIFITNSIIDSLIPSNYSIIIIYVNNDMIKKIYFELMGVLTIEKENLNKRLTFHVFS